MEGGQGGVEGPGLGGAVVRGLLSHPHISRWAMQVPGRATGTELGQQVRAACAGPVLIAIACAQSYLGRPVPGEDDDRHRDSSLATQVTTHSVPHSRIALHSTHTPRPAHTTVNRQYYVCSACAATRVMAQIYRSTGCRVFSGMLSFGLDEVPADPRADDELVHGGGQPTRLGLGLGLGLALGLGVGFGFGFGFGLGIGLGLGLGVGVELGLMRNN